MLFGSCFGEHGENLVWARLPGGKGYGKAEEGSSREHRSLSGRNRLSFFKSRPSVALE